MGKSISVRTAAALAAVWMLAGVSTQALTFTWNPGTTGNWNTNGNWVGGSVPPNDGTADVLLDGETATASTTYGDVNLNLKSLTIAAGDKYDMNANVYRAVTIGAGGLNNAGTISVTGSSGRIHMGISGANRNSGTMEAVGASRVLYIGYGKAFTLDNTGGILRATSGGTLRARSGGDNPITGGQFIIGAGSFADHESHNDGFTLNNVAASNAGTYKVILESATGGNRWGSLTGTTVFANSGTLDIRNLSTSATANIDAYFTVGGTASLTTTGASQINIVQNSTSGGTGHNAYLQLDASTTATAFDNNGAVAITSVASSQGTAQLRSSRPLTNAGTITVDGPFSSIQMAGQTLTQTAGTLTVKNGGSVVAGTLVVSGGTITGDGTVTANTVIQGTHSPGNSPGVQTIDGDLTYSGGSAVVNWELIANATATRGAQFDGVDVSGDLDFAAATSLNLVFNLGGSAVDWSDALWSADHLGTAGWRVYDVGGSTTSLGNLTIAGLDWQDGQGDWLSAVQPKGYFDLFFDVDSGNVYLNYALIPEPASAALLGLAGLALLRRRR